MANFAFQKIKNLSYYINHLPGRTLFIENKEFLFFSGTSYLGIGHNAVFQQRLVENTQELGSIYSASRNNMVRLEVYEQLESFMAVENGSEAALSVSSGMLAGQLVTRYLEHLTFYYEPSCHPALWKAASIQSMFSNYDDFCHRIGDVVKKNAKPCVVCCNGIDTLTCDKYQFSWIKDLEGDFPVYLIVDDSHVLGMLNKDSLEGNFNTIKYLCPSNVELIVTASMAKALGLPAGVILGNNKTIKAISELPHFIGASPTAPAYFKTFLDTQQEYLNLKAKLGNNIETFKILTTPVLPFFKFLEYYPVFYFSSDWLFHKLKESGIFISCFSYPKLGDPPICRVVMSALHTKEDIKSLSQNLTHLLMQNSEK
jgi:8-amino-7-oxononanoate synthase